MPEAFDEVSNESEATLPRLGPVKLESVQSEVGGTAANTAPRSNFPPPEAASNTNQLPHQLSDNSFSSSFCIVAQREDGTTYDADLLLHVVEYRALRALSLAQKIPPDQQNRLEELERHLRQAPDEQSNPSEQSILRAFQRYECQFMAAVQIPIEDEQGETSTVQNFKVTIHDISAGGIKACASHQLTPGDPANLVVNMAGEESQQITFPARVAWVSKESFGLMFAGPAEITTIVNLDDENESL